MAQDSTVLLEEQANVDTDEHKENVALTPSIQIVSDVHLEFTGVFDKMQDEDRFPKCGAPILCLLGDIGYPHEKPYWRFVDKMIDEFKYIILITGNHEYYKSEYHVVHQTIRDKLANTARYKDKVYFLHNEVLELDDVLPDTRILGTTLWVNYLKAEQDVNIAIQYEYQINDFRRIKYQPLPDEEQKDNDDEDDEKKQDETESGKKVPLLTSVVVNRLHTESVAFLERELKRAEQDKKQCIVLTHHGMLQMHTFTRSEFFSLYTKSRFVYCVNVRTAPTDYRTIHPGTSHSERPINYGMNYASMEYLFKKPLVAWCFGHTHHNVDYFVRSKSDDNQEWTTRIAANQQGYLVGLHKAPEDYSNQKVLRFPNEHVDNQQVPVIEFEELQKQLIDKTQLVPDPAFITGTNNEQDEDLKQCKEGCLIL